MRRALALAAEAAQRGEVPVGALVVSAQGEILAEAFNLRESRLSPTAHAEVLALEEASAKTGSWRLSGATLYVTLEPCLMCAGAALSARVEKVIFGAHDPKAGAVKTLYQVLEDSRLNHRCEVVGGLLEEECAQLLSDFFKKLRQKK